ncbi:MAG: YnbE family lipoprotein [Hyphomonas sp.]
MSFKTQLIAGAGLFVLAACVHTIRIEPSDKPIKIDLNITQEVRITLDKPVEDLIADNPDLF